MTKRAGRRTRAIPESLAPHFQEFDLEALNLRDDSIVIMQRTLEYGNLDELRWLFQTYGRAGISEFVRRRGQQRLSKRAFYFWRRYFRLKNWKRAPQQSLREQVWPF